MVRCSRLILYCPCPTCWINFSKDPWFLLAENSIEKPSTGTLGVPAAVGLVLLPDPPSGQKLGRIFFWSVLNTNFSVSIYIKIQGSYQYLQFQFFPLPCLQFSFLMVRNLAPVFPWIYLLTDPPSSVWQVVADTCCPVPTPALWEARPSCAVLELCSPLVVATLILG